MESLKCRCEIPGRGHLISDLLQSDLLKKGGQTDSKEEVNLLRYRTGILFIDHQNMKGKVGFCGI